MAVWQFRFILLPEKVLLSKYEILPPAIPHELAEDFAWWADVQPPTGFEDQIDLILPRRASWSASGRMWGHEDRDDAHVLYVDDTRRTVMEIAFRFDASSISSELVKQTCILARQLGCVLMIADYEIFVPEESIVLATIQHSTAKKFVDDPVATLGKPGQPEMQKRFNYLIKDKGNDPSGKG
jgi:hypothetical protein